MSSAEVDPNYYEEPFDGNEFIDQFLTEEISDESINQIIDWMDNNSYDLDLFETLTIDDISKVLDILDTHSNVDINVNCLNTSSTVTNVLNKSSKRKKRQKMDSKPGKQLRFLIKKLREEGIITDDNSKNNHLNGKIIGDLKNRIVTRSQSRLEANKTDTKETPNYRNVGKSDNSLKSKRFSTTITRSDSNHNDLDHNLLNKRFIRKLYDYYNKCGNCGQKFGKCVVDCQRNQFRPLLPYVKLKKLDPKLIKNAIRDSTVNQNAKNSGISLLKCNIEEKSPKIMTRELRVRVKPLDLGISLLNDKIVKKLPEISSKELRSSVEWPKRELKVCKLCNPLKQKSKSRILSKFLYNVFTKPKPNSKSVIPMRVKTNRSWDLNVKSSFGNIHRYRKK